MQRHGISDQVIQTVLLADGIVSIIFAFFAHYLGFDPTPDWGSSRVLIGILGVILIGIAFSLFKTSPAFIKVEKNKILFLLGHVLTFVFIVYAWFITFGTFTEWRASTHYYSLLADAFEKGQLNVDLDPGATLLGLEDPYNPDIGRAIDDDIWDMSFYNGKLYLYWGPVPSLILLPFQLISNKQFQDIYLVYFFFCALLLFNTLLIIKLWRLLYRDVPIYNVILSILVIGLILPVLWSINIPNVYVAAIGAGQFFLMGGTYFVLIGFEKSLNKFYLFLAGLFWACAVGSRAMNVLPLLLIVPLTLLWMVRISPKPFSWKQTISPWLALISPLVAGAILIGWYNWARFDSPFEFGFRYQLTIHNLNKISSLTFQPDYLLPNLYAYVLQPFEFISEFPFIQPVTIAQLFEAFRITPPKIFYSGLVTGFFIYGPFLLFAFFSFRQIYRNLKEKSPSNNLYQIIVYILTIGFLINFLSLLFFFFGQLRYSVDFISQITLLAILGYWEVIHLKLKANDLRSKSILFTANLFIIFTIAVSLLLSFTSETGRFMRYNPILIEKINMLFGI